MNWVKKYGANLNIVRMDKKAAPDVVEVDELCSYVGEKITS